MITNLKGFEDYNSERVRKQLRDFEDTEILAILDRLYEETMDEFMYTIQWHCESYEKMAHYLGYEDVRKYIRFKTEHDDALTAWMNTRESAGNYVQVKEAYYRTKEAYRNKRDY